MDAQEGGLGAIVAIVESCLRMKGIIDKLANKSNDRKITVPFGSLLEDKPFRLFFGSVLLLLHHSFLMSV